MHLPDSDCSQALPPSRRDPYFTKLQPFLRQKSTIDYHTNHFGTLSFFKPYVEYIGNLQKDGFGVVERSFPVFPRGARVLMIEEARVGEALVDFETPNPSHELSFGMSVSSLARKAQVLYYLRMLLVSSYCRL